LYFRGPSGFRGAGSWKFIVGTPHTSLLFWSSWSELPRRSCLIGLVLIFKVDQICAVRAAQIISVVKVEATDLILLLEIAQLPVFWCKASVLSYFRRRVELTRSSHHQKCMPIIHGVILSLATGWSTSGGTKTDRYPHIRTQTNTNSQNYFEGEDLSAEPCRRPSRAPISSLLHSL
jgi:hypothetical protein